MIMLHSCVITYVSTKLFGIDLRSLFTDGVADQSILGPIFQPSIFGVLMILSLSMFVSERTIAAVVALSLGGSFHSNYLLPAAVMTVCYMIQRKCEGFSLLKMLGIGMLALFIVLPVLIYDYRAFTPTSPEQWAKGMNILRYVELHIIRDLKYGST